MGIRRFVLLCIFAFVISAVSGQGYWYNGTSSSTPLDNYIAHVDSIYSWNLVSSYETSGAIVYTINMTSQYWVNASFSNRYIWTHTIEIAVPNGFLFYADRVFLFINGGNTNGNGGNVTRDLSDAYKTGLITAELYQVPNQPITFANYLYNPYGDTQTPVSEDGIISRTFRIFMNSDLSDPSILALFPMTKAAVRAMDTISAFLLQQYPGKVASPIEKFFVAGGSKRGWTSWLTAAVDKRVMATIPIVAPLLELPTDVQQIYRSYDSFGYALQEYVDNRVWDFYGLPQFTKLMSCVDPVSYASRYANIPKFVVDGTQDQFFLPDLPRNFWSKLPGNKWLFMVANAAHSLSARAAQVVRNVLVWSQTFTQNVALPTVTWSLKYSNASSVAPTITLTSTGGPPLVNMTLWQCTTHPGTRDFRFSTCDNSSDPACFTGLTWTNSLLDFTVNGDNSATITAQLNNLNIASSTSQQQWTGFFIEVTYDVTLLGQHFPFVVTSEVNVFPDFYPFPAFVPNYTAVGQKAPSSTTTSSVLSLACSFSPLLLLLTLLLCLLKL